MNKISQLFQTNTILKELCNKTYKTEFKNRSNRLQRGLVSNKKIDEILNINDFIQQDITQDIDNMSNKRVIKEYKLYKSIGSINDLVPFTTRVVSELLNIKPTIDNIILIKENIKQIFKNELNESTQEINENIKLDLFFKWVAKPILESNNTEIDLDEMNLPTIVKILIEDNLNEYLVIYNKLSVEQLYEQMDKSSEDIIKNMNAVDIIETFRLIINHINAEWEDESIPLHNLELNSDKITVESLIDDILKNNSNDYSSSVEDLVEKYLNSDQKRNNAAINYLVTIKADKSNYINLMSAVFKEFDKFLNKYDLHKKISNWTKDYKIHQSFVSIVGELMLINKSGHKSDNLYRSVFTNNMIFVMNNILDGYVLDSNKNELLHTISDLYSNLGRLNSIFNSLTDSEKNELKSWMMTDVTTKNIKRYIEDFKFKLHDIVIRTKPIRNEDETDDGQIYTLDYYIIPYQFIRELNPDIQLNTSKINRIINMEGKSIREIRAALKKISDENKKNRSNNKELSNDDATNAGIVKGKMDSNDDSTKPGR